MRFSNRKKPPCRMVFTGYVQRFFEWTRAAKATVLFMTLWMIARSVYPTPLTDQLPMRLYAQKADLNQQTHTGEYTGDVRLHQGESHLRAARAITKTNERNQLTEAAAYGNVQKQVHFWTKKDPKQPVIHAYADEIHYFPLQHCIELIGNARVMQEKNAFLAPYIRYDIQKEHVTSDAKGKSRIHILFYPEKKV